MSKVVKAKGKGKAAIEPQQGAIKEEQQVARKEERRLNGMAMASNYAHYAKEFEKKKSYFS